MQELVAIRPLVENVGQRPGAAEEQEGLQAAAERKPLRPGEFPGLLSGSLNQVTIVHKP